MLSDFYERVTVYERDDLPDGPANRSAVPQGRHVHLLMARGAQEFEEHFPGLLDDMVAAGVPILENRPDCIHFGAAGHVLGTQHRLQTEFTAYVPSRPQLEWQIRRRVTAIDNVDVVRAAVSEPRFDAARQRVTGVELDSGDAVDADLVVDAAGRGTRLPVWLAQWGFERPREDSIDVGIGYATHQLRIPDGLIAEKVIVAGASCEQPLGLGMLYYEDGTWGLTTFGVAKVEPPHDFAAMCALADEIVPAHVAAAIRQGEPIGDVAFHKYPTSRWRRYDKLDRFPAGIIPFGDAVVSFNPTFGQGMTMTSLQAGHLQAGARNAGCRCRPRIQPSDRQDHLPGVDDERDRRSRAAPGHGADAVVVPPGGEAVRPVPRCCRNGSRSGRMVFAPVQPARQPLHGPVGTARRPHHPAQHAAVAGGEAEPYGRRAGCQHGWLTYSNSSLASWLATFLPLIHLRTGCWSYCRVGQPSGGLR